MSKPATLSLLVVSLVACGAGADIVPVQNGDMETVGSWNGNPYPDLWWGRAGVTPSEAENHTPGGVRSMAIGLNSGSPNSNYLWNSTIWGAGSLDLFTPGETYTFGLWMKASQDFQGSVSFGLVINNGPANGLHVGPGYTPTSDWELYTYEYTFPTDFKDGATDLRAPEIRYNVQAGTVYIDDATITPEPATMALLSMGGLTLLRRRR